MLKARLAYFSPGRILLLSFLFAIGIGTLILALPLSLLQPVSWLDLLFTATSSTCVTGLNVVPLSSFTFFGQCVILSLIQIGGLGLMTLSFFFASLILNLGMTTRLMVGQILEFESWSKVRRFLMVIIGITVITEVGGAFLLFTQFRSQFPLEDALFYSFFHSISSFCNAGISLFDTSLIEFRTSPVTLYIFSSMMIIGSIGFIVWYDLARIAHAFFRRFRGEKKFARLSLHSNIVLFSTVVLTLTGASLFFILERSNLLFGLSPFQKITNAFFMGLSARGIGFSSLNLSHATEATLFLCIPLMIIGASPGSTGSGIKTTTFVVFIATLVSIMRGRKAVEISNRRIPAEQVLKTMALVTLAITWIFMCTFLLLITEHNADFMSILFETVSAFGTCGFSTGITPHLSTFGKIIIMITMVIGRIGSLTLILALRRKKKEEQQLYTFPEERIMIG